MEKTGHSLGTRWFFFLLLLFLQFSGLILAIQIFSEESALIHFFCRCLSFACVIFIINSPEEPAFKICWIVMILSFPLLGGCIFLLIRGRGLSKSHKKALDSMKQRTHTILSPLFLPESLLAAHPDAKSQLYYLQQQASCPGFQHTKTTYFDWGEGLFSAMLQALKKAKRYVFLEYFILEEGIFWNSILEILVEKQKQGLEIRLIYDDAGCFFSFPKKYIKKLCNLGLKIQVFNPLHPILSTKLNNRDHRKWMIIDGTVAFTGGVNLADEYINKRPRFGIWKDSGLKLEGPAVWAITVMFLSMWEYCSKVKENYFDFFPKNIPVFQETSLVLPYTDIPIDYESVGQQVFLNLITKAKRFIHLTSPYLILDTATHTALCSAAKSGIEVCIITPHTPDKKLVFQVTRAFYPLLLEAGVKIYEYSPGFIHSKNVIVDDEFATIGTINLDFRSLFLHFENGIWLYRAPCIQAMEADFQTTLRQCQAYTTQKESKVSSILRSILRVFSPLM